MDMINDNDRLLQQFFSEAASQQIADNGFTERVMQRLPMRMNWFVRVWNTGMRRSLPLPLGRNR